MKLRITVTFYHEITDLNHYEATTVQEAAVNQLRWLENGDCTIHELIPDDDVEYQVEAVE